MRPYFRKKKFIFIPLGIIALVTVVSFVVMGLWNYLMPVIFHLGTITFWQAAGLFILCKILFGFGKGGYRGGAPWMRRRMEERFKNMTPEQKEKFRQHMRQHCGDHYGRWKYDEGFPFEHEKPSPGNEDPAAR